MNGKLLAATFCEHHASAEPTDRDALDAQLASILETARTSWPTVALDPLVFVEFLAGRISDDKNSDDDPEVAVVKERCRAHFKTAFEKSLERLTTRERTMLRCHYVDGLSTREMGKIYAKNGTTVLRWLASARSKLLSGMRDDMRNQFGLNQSELASMYRAIASQFEFSVQRMLAPRQDDDCADDVPPGYD